jgi:hypothetical protein
MEITKEVQTLLALVNQKVTTQPPVSAKVQLPSNLMSLGELAELLNVLAKEYGTTLPVLIRKLDRVSGDVKALERIYSQNDNRVEWTPEEDELLAKNVAILIRWKG